MTKTESVWDYPRPPKMEAVSRHLRVVHQGTPLVDAFSCFRILETSHPPVYYVPPASVAMQRMTRSASRPSFCEFKGLASYWDLRTANGFVRDVAWSYDKPAQAYAQLTGYLAFYANRVDECWVDDERVVPQAGDFYGGWITGEITGPFKGPPGTQGW